MFAYISTMKKYFITSFVLFLIDHLHGQDFPWNEGEELPLNQLLGGDILNADKNFHPEKRFIRSNHKSEDKPNSNDEDNYNPGDNSAGTVGNGDGETAIIINEICSSWDVDNNLTKANSNQTIRRSDSVAKEKLLCQLLKKLTMSSTRSQKKPKFGGDEYLPEDYNKYEAPKLKESLILHNKTVLHTEKPVAVEAFLNVRGIVDFDDNDGVVTLDMDVILLWTDGSIFNEYQNLDKDPNDDPAVVLSPTFLKKLWTPDIYIEEVMSLSQPTFMGNSITVVLHPKTGVVIYRSRVLAKLNCDMDFTYYPADIQTCTFTLKSFSYTTDRLTLSWILQGGTGVYLHDVEDPNFDYHILSFTSNDTFLDIGPASDPNTLYSSLKFTLQARRKMTYQLVQTYFASVFFVLVTWLCFLISPDMFEVRVGIAMSTLLTLTAMFASVRDTTPKVSYVKAIDIWMVASIIFIFAALFGFTITAWIKRGLQRMQAPKEDDEPNIDLLEYKKRRVLNEVETKKILHKYRMLTVAVERFGIYILSLAYVLYNVIYWTWLMQQSSYLQWNTNSTFNKING